MWDREETIPNQRKEIALLKLEYLKRSKVLRELYEYLKALQIDPKTPLPDKFKRPAEGGQYFSHFAWTIGDTKGPFPYATFEEWLKHREEIITRGYLRLSAKPVRDIRSDIENFLRLSWGEFISGYGREPTVHELIERIDSYFGPKRDYPFRTYFLRMQYTDGTREEYKVILNDVAKIIKLGKINKRIVENELNHYLNVYDLRMAGLSNDEVILKIGTKQEKRAIGLATKSKWEEAELDPANIRRNYRRCFEKAKKIIENAEKKEFPGKY